MVLSFDETYEENKKNSLLHYTNKIFDLQEFYLITLLMTDKL